MFDLEFLLFFVNIGNLLRHSHGVLPIGILKNLSRLWTHIESFYCNMNGSLSIHWCYTLLNGSLSIELLLHTLSSYCSLTHPFFKILKSNNSMPNYTVSQNRWGKYFKCYFVCFLWCNYFILGTIDAFKVVTVVRGAFTVSSGQRKIGLTKSNPLGFGTCLHNLYKQPYTLLGLTWSIGHCDFAYAHLSLN